VIRERPAPYPHNLKKVNQRKPRNSHKEGAKADANKAEACLSKKGIEKHFPTREAKGSNKLFLSYDEDLKVSQLRMGLQSRV
jgi:hypothetical protein